MAGYKLKYADDKGKHQKLFDDLWDKLVPHSGMSETTNGEAIRCLSRFYDERCCNGHCNDRSYECMFLSEWLEYNEVSFEPEINDDMSDENLDLLVDTIVLKVSQLLKRKVASSRTSIIRSH